MDEATRTQKPVAGAPAFGAVSAQAVSAGDRVVPQSRDRQCSRRVAAWILIGTVGICVAGCQTQSGSPRLPGGSKEACAERARQEAPDKRMGADRQRDRWFIYRACMHESGLKA